MLSAVQSKVVSKLINIIKGMKSFLGKVIPTTRKSDMTHERLEQSQGLVEKFLTMGWSEPEHQKDFESNTHMVYDFTSHKRTGKMLLRFQINLDKKYVSLQISEYPIRNSEFIIRFDKEKVILESFLDVLENLSAKSHDEVIPEIKKFSGAFEGAVSFFADDEETVVTPENAQTVIFSDYANKEH